ncbi:MAG: InlB B-repeat-containing protein [Lachnospiraceae bacterium]|nr:InlB B-repeat-containing protein [Lachnospiraceae bacterium]
MADNIVLKTYKGGNVTPQDDAIIYETAVPGSGIFKGCEVTYARGNVLHISQGFGMIRGRFFEVYETEIDVRLADVGETLDGRVYIHLDLSNTDEPIKILAQAASELPPLDADVNINYNNSSYDLELAIFTVSSAGLSGLTKVFPTLKAGGGGGGGGGETLTRATSYSVGDAVTAVGAPGWATFVCTQAGTTAAYEPSGYSRITKAGDMVLDGTAVFTARNIIGELDSVISSNASLGESMQTLDGKMAEMMSSTGLVMKLVSIEEYRALKQYSASTIYLCYEDAATKRVTRIFVGEDKVYAAGIKVTYQIDTGYALERTVPDKEDAIATAPPAALEGYTFVGWRQDSSAEKKVLSEFIISGEEPVMLYAVFKKQMTIGMMPNGGTLTVSGAKESFTAFCYYNNGNAQSEPTAAPANPYTRKNMSFCGWSTDSLSTPSYKPGELGVFPADATLYAMWVATEYDFVYTGSYVTFVIPQDGIYEFEVWGASGADAKADSLVAEGGLGGHSKGYKKMKKDEVVYVYNGGSPNGTSSGANGGGRGNTYSSSKQYGAGGGGSTHIATKYGELGYNNSNGASYANRSCVLIVAGGGGGGGINNGTANKGGDGGGERGGNGSDGALGGRQISNSSSPSTNFGYTSPYSSSSMTESGGGGGWYGGHYGLRGESGAGGSGYIDGVAPFTHNGKYYPAETEAGVNKGHGKAFIRYIECA